MSEFNHVEIFFYFCSAPHGLLFLLWMNSLKINMSILAMTQFSTGEKGVFDQ